MLRKTKKDDPDDDSGGPISLWTYKGRRFVVRSDIGRDFTADTAMYMEMLHREYSAAYKVFCGVPPRVNEPVEVVVFKDMATFVAAGGNRNTVGNFSHSTRRRKDRGPRWPAPRLRLTQFSNGVADFAKWPKQVLKHEAAHFELQIRLGLRVDCPVWWNEGQAGVFEDWDFDLTVKENLKAVPRRGYRARVCGEIQGTAAWKDFSHLWTIDSGQWHQDLGSGDARANYAQAWSLAAYMMTSGVEGRKAFRKIFNLSRRVGADEKTDAGKAGSHAWMVAFPDFERAKLEKQWNDWAAQAWTSGGIKPSSGRLGPKGKRCPKCFGRGTIRCTECKGEGRLACWKCAGKGVLIATSKGQQDEQACPKCEGRKTLSCKRCQGARVHACDRCDEP